MSKRNPTEREILISNLDILADEEFDDTWRPWHKNCDGCHYGYCEPEDHEDEEAAFMKEYYNG